MRETSKVLGHISQGPPERERRGLVCTWYTKVSGACIGGVRANRGEVSDSTERKEDFSSHRRLSDSGRVCFVKWRASFWEQRVVVLTEFATSSFPSALLSA